MFAEPLYAGRRPGGSRTGSTLSLVQQQQQQLTGLASHVVAYHFCQVMIQQLTGLASHVVAYHFCQVRIRQLTGLASHVVAYHFHQVKTQQLTGWQVTWWFIIFAR
jgi:hypothetical protein